MEAHQLSKKGDTIHAWHFDIQRNDVGRFRGDHVTRHIRVGRGTDHFDLGVASRARFSTWRTTAESSTIRTRIIQLVQCIDVKDQGIVFDRQNDRSVFTSQSIPVVRISDNDLGGIQFDRLVRFKRSRQPVPTDDIGYFTENIV